MKSKDPLRGKKLTKLFKLNHLHLTGRALKMFPTTFQLNYTANTNCYTQLLINKGNSVDKTWHNHRMPTDFNLPLNPSWNTVCDSVVPASCYCQESDGRKRKKRKSVMKKCPMERCTQQPFIKCWAHL